MEDQSPHLLPQKENTIVSGVGYYRAILNTRR